MTKKEGRKMLKRFKHYKVEISRRTAFRIHKETGLSVDFIRQHLRHQKDVFSPPLVLHEAP